MFQAVVIQASPDEAPLLRAMATATGLVSVIREVPAPPGGYELARLLNSTAPDLVLIDLRGAAALECALSIAGISPDSAIVGFACPPSLASAARHAGCGALTPPGASVEDLAAAIRTAMEDKRAEVLDGLFSFLPAKAGSGASTVVLNTAAALTRLAKRVLVIDADLRSGILAVLIGARRRGGLEAVLRRSDQIDGFLWADSVTTAHGVDFLLPSRSLDAPLPEWSNYYRLLDFVADRYDLILADLPEVINPATLEIVRRSRGIYSVCTPELPALDLAAQRHEELSRIGSTHGRTAVLLNRYHKNDPPPDQLAGILGQEIAKVFPNDYPRVRAAITAAAPVPAECPLGSAFGEFAAQLTHQGAPSQPTLKTRLRRMLGFATA
jgi:MinD-like ATPase involved in chromosome partitioning or flagellar assembly